MDFHTLEKIFMPVTVGIDLIGIIIIIWGFLFAVLRFCKAEMSRFTGGCSLNGIQKIRAEFGVYILLGLEFMIASDIIHTVIRRTREELYFLVVIVVIRTAISYFLGKELEHVRNNE